MVKRFSIGDQVVLVRPHRGNDRCYIGGKYFGNGAVYEIIEKGQHSCYFGGEFYDWLINNRLAPGTAGSEWWVFEGMLDYANGGPW